MSEDTPLWNTLVMQKQIVLPDLLCSPLSPTKLKRMGEWVEIPMEDRDKGVDLDASFVDSHLFREGMELYKEIAANGTGSIKGVLKPSPVPRPWTAPRRRRTRKGK